MCSSVTNAWHCVPRAFAWRVSLATTIARPSRIAARALPTKTVAGAVLVNASARCRPARFQINRRVKVPVTHGRSLKRAVQDAMNINRAEAAWPILRAFYLHFFIPTFVVSVCDLEHFLSMTMYCWSFFSGVVGALRTKSVCQDPRKGPAALPICNAQHWRM